MVPWGHTEDWGRCSHRSLLEGQLSPPIVDVESSLQPVSSHQRRKEWIFCFLWCTEAQGPASFNVKAKRDEFLRNNQLLLLLLMQKLQGSGSTLGGVEHNAVRVPLNAALARTQSELDSCVNTEELSTRQTWFVIISQLFHLAGLDDSGI